MICMGYKSLVYLKEFMKVSLFQIHWQGIDAIEVGVKTIEDYNYFSSVVIQRV
jgi:hypothetical protein